MTDSAPTLHDRILVYLHEQGKPLGPREISDALDANYETVRSTLGTMKDRRLLSQPRRGYYVPASVAEAPSGRRTLAEFDAEHGPIAPPVYIDGKYCIVAFLDGSGHPLYGLTPGGETVAVGSFVGRVASPLG